MSSWKLLREVGKHLRMSLAGILLEYFVNQRSFLIPIVERLLRLDAPLKKHHVGAIIISPTRELATQIHTVLCSLLKFHAPSAAALEPEDEDSDMEDVDAPPKPTFPAGTLKVVPQLLLGGSVTPAQDLSAFLKKQTNVLIGTPVLGYL